MKISCIYCHRDFDYDRKKGHTVNPPTCNSCRVTERRRRIKRILVEERGSRCERCGYDKSLRALSFHHRDPSKKSFSISHNRTVIGIEKMRDEVEKCDLLCANCHMEVEDDLAGVSSRFDS